MDTSTYLHLIKGSESRKETDGGGCELEEQAATFTYPRLRSRVLHGGQPLLWPQ